MKKFLKKTLIISFILATVIVSASSFAFAKGSSNSGTDRSDKKVSHNPGIVNADKFPGAILTTNFSSYLLVVSTGNVNTTSVDNVIIKYYTSAANKTSDIYATQVLEPNRMESAHNLGTLSSVAAAGHTEYILSCYGSRVQTYYSFINANAWTGIKSKITGTATLQADGSYAAPSFEKQWPGRALKDYSTYASWFVDEGSESEGYTFSTFAEKVVSKDTFAPNSVEYLRFRFEYPLYDIKSISFVCSVSSGSGASGEWMVQGWSLYELKDDSADDKLQISANNYAFLSDQLSLVFNGTLKYKSTSVTNNKVMKNGFQIQGNGIITYNNKSLIQSKFTNASQEQISGTAGSDYYTEIVANSYDVMCFESANKSVSFTDKKVYNIAINLADEYGAGIEGFHNDSKASTLSASTLAGPKLAGQWAPIIEKAIAKYKTLMGSTPALEIKYTDVEGGLGLVDCLKAEIKYTDTSGMKCVLTVPVISNAVLEALMVDNNENNFSKESQTYKNFMAGTYTTFAKQGESLIFSVEIPRIASMDSIVISYYGPEGSRAEDDNIGIASIGVYDNGGFNISADRAAYIHPDSRALSIEVPNYFYLEYASTDEKVHWLDNDTDRIEYKLKSFISPLVAKTARSLPATTSYDDCYLVTLTTSNFAEASTHNNIYATLLYEDMKGNEMKSFEYDVKEECQNYMGYTNGYDLGKLYYLDELEEKVSSGAITKENYGVLIKRYVEKYRSDISYLYGVNAGHSVSFIAKIRDVSKFTGINIKIDNDPDDWQMQSVSIVKIDSISKRKTNIAGNEYLCKSLYGEDLCYEYDVYNEWYYTRTVVGDVKIQDNNAVILVANGEDVTYMFEDKSSSGEVISRKDVSDQKYSMDYATVTSDLGYTTVVKNYTVNVQVADNIDSTGNDNAGSNNMFYFQLQFEKGKSSYVLANSQLDADGFRSGQLESFNISTNQDYGDLKSINIIADDVTENSSPLDKLNIKEISVIKQNSTGPNKKYVAEDVGWITTAYKDQIEAQERETRSEDDLAYVIPISYSGYSVDLEIGITWGEEVANELQYQGDLTMDILYINSDGESKSLPNIQCVQLMYAYRNQTPRFNNTTQRYVSDATSMFQPGTTDRFIVTVDDISTVTAINLHFEPLSATKINISAITMGVLQGYKSKAVRSEFNQEYYIPYPIGKEPILLAELQDKFTGAIGVSSGYVKKNIIVSCAGIAKYEDIQSYDNIPTRYPQSANDTINLYINLAEGTVGPIEGNYDLYCAVKYSSATTGKTYRSTADQDDFNVRKVINGNGKQVTQLYIEGMGAENMTNINAVQLFCSDIERTLKVDSAMIQRVRDKVVIDTYNVRFTSSIFSKLGGAETNVIASAKGEQSKQVIKLVLGETAATTLTAESKDIGVKIEYSTNNLNQRTYKSAYAYATDFGYTEIHEGKELEFTLYEYDVANISKIILYGSGGIETEIDPENYGGINVICYETNAAGEDVETAWYYATEKVTIDKAEKSVEVLSGKDNLDTPKLVTLVFTSPSTGTADSAGSVPIRATIYYKTKVGSKTAHISDLRDYVAYYVNADSAFAQGATTRVNMMIPGIEQLVTIDVEPYDDNKDNTASFYVGTVTYQVEGVDDPTAHTINFSSTALEGDPLVLGLATTRLTVTANTGGTSYSTVDGTLSYTTIPKATQKFQVKGASGNEGYRCDLYLVKGSDKQLISSTTSSSGAFEYPSLSYEKNGEDTLYRFNFVSLENTSAVAIVDVTIKGSMVSDDAAVNPDSN